MDTTLQSVQSPTTREEYREALTRLTQRAQENGVAVESYWCCRGDGESGEWEVEVTPLMTED